MDNKQPCTFLVGAARSELVIPLAKSVNVLFIGQSIRPQPCLPQERAQTRRNHQSPFHLCARASTGLGYPLKPTFSVRVVSPRQCEKNKPTAALHFAASKPTSFEQAIIRSSRHFHLAFPFFPSSLDPFLFSHFTNPKSTVCGFFVASSLPGPSSTLQSPFLLCRQNFLD